MKNHHADVNKPVASDATSSPETEPVSPDSKICWRLAAQKRAYSGRHTTCAVELEAEIANSTFTVRYLRGGGRAELSDSENPGERDREARGSAGERAYRSTKKSTSSAVDATTMKPKAWCVVSSSAGGASSSSSSSYAAARAAGADGAAARWCTGVAMTASPSARPSAEWSRASPPSAAAAGGLRASAARASLRRSSSAERHDAYAHVATPSAQSSTDEMFIHGSGRMKSAAVRAPCSSAPFFLSASASPIVTKAAGMLTGVS